MQSFKVFLFLYICIAIIDWVALRHHWQRIGVFSKPSVMIVLLIWILSNIHENRILILFAAGLVFSLIGDVLLNPPTVRFIPGLVVFFIAHIFYIFGLNTVLPPVSIPSGLLLVFFAVTATQIFKQVQSSIPKNHPIRLPVAAYTFVVTVMALSASVTLIRDDWSSVQALLTSLGGLLFFYSDARLAWGKFVMNDPSSLLDVRVAYHLGQLGLVVGAAIHYLPG